MKIAAINPQLAMPQGSQSLADPAAKTEFGNVLTEMVNEVNKLQNESNRKIADSLTGQEDLHEAMLSLEKSGLGLKVLIQVRNKMVQAYEELARMPM